MAKIYTVPTEIGSAPAWFWGPEYAEKEQAWLDSIRKFLQKRKPNDPLVGREIRFQVADNYARYMVASMKPLELIHIPLGDGYQFQYANRLTAKDVKTEIDREERLAKLFGAR